jgi:protein disulfide-isomerase A1
MRMWFLFYQRRNLNCRCGHCKKAKPEISAAAEELKDNPQVAFGAVDCTVEKSLCAQYEVNGYPQFKYFRYYDQVSTVRTVLQSTTVQSVVRSIAPSRRNR